MKVIGIDPGLQVTGYGLIDTSSGAPELIEAGVFRSVPKQPIERRLLDIYTSIELVIADFRPDVMSIEDLYAHYRHPKTAVIMGHARGLFFLAAARASIPVHTYSATRIKKSLTGNGHASKEQVARLVCGMLGCDRIDGPADVTDALAAALCHCNVVSHGGVL